MFLVLFLFFEFVLVLRNVDFGDNEFFIFIFWGLGVVGVKKEFIFFILFVGFFLIVVFLVCKRFCFFNRSI